MPERVRAPQRGLASMGPVFRLYLTRTNSAGLSAFCGVPGLGAHVAHNGLTTRFDSYLADRDALLAAPAAYVKRLK